MKIRFVVGTFLALGALTFGACGTGTLGRGAENISCTPGRAVTVACGGMGIGSCEGDPILDVCDGASGPASGCTGTSAPGFISSNDDGGDGRCPLLTVTCPTSGSLGVRPRAFSGVPTCNWQHREASGI